MQMSLAGSRSRAGPWPSRSRQCAPQGAFLQPDCVPRPLRGLPAGLQSQLGLVLCLPPLAGIQVIATSPCHTLGGSLPLSTARQCSRFLRFDHGHLSEPTLLVDDAASVRRPSQDYHKTQLPRFFRSVVHFSQRFHARFPPGDAGRASL